MRRRSSTERAMSERESVDLQGRIRNLLERRKAILLAHNYQRPEVQDVADLCGDSLELSMKASRTEAEVIVFCGVHFMAETAAVLSPEKTVLLPVITAGCPMADTITAESLRRKKAEEPDAVVVSYVNTTAEVKAESDICCTSANVVRVVRSVEPGRRILMTPDRNLALYAMKESGRELTIWDGSCPTHDSLTAAQVRKVRGEHPAALFIAHPECRPEVLALADAIRSTSGMIAYVKDAGEKDFIIGTETGILYPLSRANPDKVFIPADPGMVCGDMKKTGLQEILWALERMEPVVRVPEHVRTRARGAVERMLAVPGDVKRD
jgi:quinolinate synthase